MSRTSSREAGFGIDQQQREVGVRGAGPGRRHHRAVQLAPRREDAGRVDQQHLALAAHQDAQHAEPRGLRLGRDDREFRAGQPVQQRGFAGVRRADDRRRSRSGWSWPPADPQQVGGGAVVRRRACCRRGLRRGRPRPRPRSRTPARAAGLRARRDRSPAAPGRGPAPIPAAPSWHPWAAPLAGDHRRPRRAARTRARAQARHRDTARRAPPRSRPPARWPACARPRAPRLAPPTAPPADQGVSAIAARTGCETRCASRGPSSPSCSSGKRSASHSAISSPSTRSPMNSSRSFEPAPVEGRCGRAQARP